MEFDEINALINIEREKYQQDLKNNQINSLSQSIKQTKEQIQADQAERAAMEKVKQRAYQLKMAIQELNEAMAEHSAKLRLAIMN